MDPACGTGGFLTCTIEHKRKQLCEERPRTKRPASQHSRRGEEAAAAPAGTTNMILHGIEVPSQIRHDNTLARPLISWGPKDRVDCIVTNPPFGGMEEDGIETNFPAAFRTRETADLFLVLIMHLLKDGAAPPWCCPMAFCLAKASRPASRKSC
jgi:type I restriction enzyme M protein